MGVSIFSPAKINLYLAVTGRRSDGYHDLVSVVAQLDFGDQLVAESRGQRTAEGRQFSLECSDQAVPVDDTNLVLKAAQAFVAVTGWKGGVQFKLTKHIPPGAGLGGGSSNAVAALRALNKLAGGVLEEDELAGIAATLGSDCTLFLTPAPVVMRGRGERIEPLAGNAERRLRGRRVLLFKPSFAISTAWAYGRMAARGTDYLPVAEAVARLAVWQQGGAPAEDLLLNNMEGAAFEKFIALPVLLGMLRAEFGVTPQMSGSGSACFALLGDNLVTAPLVERIRREWGSTAFVQEARIL
jgi:4-diphosphocytidyl-2-C-methyl-D-erythritol kinase